MCQGWIGGRCRGRRGSLVAVGDATAGQVVGRELDLDPVAGEDADVVHAHLPGDVCEHLVPVVELDPEHRVGKRLENRPFEDDRVFFGLGQRGTPGRTDWWTYRRAASGSPWTGPT